MNEHDEELARSIDPDAWRQLHKDDMSWCQSFADLIRADEREACAKVCDEAHELMNSSFQGAAAAIRARSNA